MASYTVWVHHRESVPNVLHYDANIIGENIQDELTDAEDDAHDELLEMLEDVGMGNFMDNNLGESIFGEDDDINGREDVRNFDKLLKDAQHELYPRCMKATLLSFIVKLLHVKVLNKLSNKAFNMILEIFKDILPEGNHVPESIYDAKKLL